MCIGKVSKVRTDPIYIYLTIIKSQHGRSRSPVIVRVEPNLAPLRSCGPATRPPALAVRSSTISKSLRFASPLPRARKMRVRCPGAQPVRDVKSDACRATAVQSYGVFFFCSNLPKSAEFADKLSV